MHTQIHQQMNHAARVSPMMQAMAIRRSSLTLTPSAQQRQHVPPAADARRPPPCGIGSGAPVHPRSERPQVALQVLQHMNEFMADQRMQRLVGRA